MSRFTKFLRYAIGILFGVFLGAVVGVALFFVVVMVCTAIVQPVGWDYAGSGLIAGFVIIASGTIVGGVAAALWVRSTNP